MENDSIAVITLAIVTAASNVWAAYETRQANWHYAEGNRIARGEFGAMDTYRPSRTPQLIMLILTVLTWSAVGYDIYVSTRDAVDRLGVRNSDGADA